PQPVEFGGAPLLAGYPSVASNGTIYFGHRSPGNVGEGDLHRSKFRLGSYGQPENLGRTVNTVYSEGDMCVAPDESFLIVSCWNRPDNNGESDLYISFRTEDGTWTSLLNMGSTINSEANENCPTISPDGKYFLFFRYYPETSAAITYWIDAKIIESLRAAAKGKS
ncbi:MAG: PD40 domain-containing protein, partial [Fidelibacterota bacterium]